MVLADLEDPVESGDHYLVQALVDVLFLPQERLDVLHPFEVAHGDSSRVAEDVRDHEGTALETDTLSASGVTGALAASATMRALTDSTLSMVMVPPSAAGTRMSTSSVSSSSLVMSRQLGVPQTEPVFMVRAATAQRLRPLGLYIRPSRDSSAFIHVDQCPSVCQRMA